MECIRKLKAVFSRRQDSQARELLRQRRDFARRYRRIYEACKLLEDGASARLLARNYMEHVLEEQHDPNWWNENARELLRPWFIWDYCREAGLADEPDEQGSERQSPEVLAPKQAGEACIVRIELERRPKRSDEGWLRLYCPNQAALSKLLRFRGFHREKDAFARLIGEEARPILDRAAEMGALLLEHGYRICFFEPGLREMILSERYEREHRFWIAATDQPCKLRLTYPFNSTAHRYVKLAGGRWNGKYMEMDIAGADRLEELIERFQFRTTAVARSLLDTWHEAVRQATIYHRQHGEDRRTPDNPMDGFKELLNRAPQALEDLLEPDD